MVLGNTLNILRPPEQATMSVQTGWNEDLVKNMHKVLGELAQQITALVFGGFPQGTSRPASVVANGLWLDITTPTDPILKMFDGTDDITVMTFDYTANTVTFAFELVDDTSPQLGGDLDLNGNVITGLEIGTDVQAFSAILASLASGALNAATVVTKTADEIVNDSSAFQDDDHLLFAMAANTTYLVEVTLLLEAAHITPDFKFQWTFPTSCTMFWELPNSGAWSGSIQLLDTESDTFGPTDSTVGISGLRLLAIVRNGANAGNLQLQWAQNTAHVSDSKLLKHSNLIIRDLGAT